MSAIRRALAGVALASALLPLPAAHADPLPGCVEDKGVEPADMVAPTGSAECVLRGVDGWSYQASWSQGATQGSWRLGFRAVDSNGVVRQTMDEQVGGMSRPHGFKLWDLDQDGLPELVAHIDNGAQNGTWAVWRRPAPEALFRRAGEYGAVGTVVEDGFFTAWWRLSAFEDTLTLYRFAEDGPLVVVARGEFAASRVVENDPNPKCELGETGGLAAAGLTREQARERLCRRNWA